MFVVRLRLGRRSVNLLPVVAQRINAVIGSTLVAGREFESLVHHEGVS